MHVGVRALCSSKIDCNERNTLIQRKDRANAEKSMEQSWVYMLVRKTNLFLIDAPDCSAQHIIRLYRDIVTN